MHSKAFRIAPWAVSLGAGWVQIDKTKAKKILFAEAKALDASVPPAVWVERVERLSKACESSSKTHVAFLGTSMLAKAVDLGADAFAIKAGAGTPGAFSARSLGHGVLVPNSAELQIDLGVTGREPLNNQPYFRHDRVSLEMVVIGGAREAVEILCDVLGHVDSIKTEREAREALRAFIYVRRQYTPEYPSHSLGKIGLSEREFIGVVAAFVAERSEGGKRAQAVAAGLLDVMVGSARVVAGRINDPDRHLPGDVGVLDDSDPPGWNWAFEVRDKPVSAADTTIFARKVVEAGAQRAAVLALAAGQKPIDASEAEGFASEHGVLLRALVGWRPFIREILFWTPTKTETMMDTVHARIHARLVEAEVSVAGVKRWLEAGEGGAERAAEVPPDYDSGQ